MSLLTEQEIQDLCYVELDRLFDEVAFARAIESAVIEKIKAQGPVAFRIDDVHFVDIERTAKNASDLYGWTPLYRLPEGD